jgi:hypothetical protein
MTMPEFEEHEAEQNETIASLQKNAGRQGMLVAARDAECVTEIAKIEAKDEAEIVELKSTLALERAKECNEGFPESTAIALIVVLSVVFVMVTAVLVVVVLKEKKGTPVFRALDAAPKSAAATYTTTEAKSSA